MPKVIVESHVPFVAPDAFAGLADMQVLPPEEISPRTVRHAVALIVRTRTRCNADLLSGSDVRLVATATIGTDHFDFPYLAAQGIEAVSAPGCNAPAVEQYVWSTILHLRPQWRQLTLGVVGCGHVGALVVDRATQLGMRVVVCDPPRQEVHGGWLRGDAFRAGSEPFVSLEELCAQADIITFHTPHIAHGPWATHHLASTDLLLKWVKRTPLVINAARGPIVDTPALIEALRCGTVSDAAIDCWEGEPRLSLDLLPLCRVATPHIAGYSLQGKIRATEATVSAVRRFLGSDIPYIVTSLANTNHHLGQSASQPTSQNTSQPTASSTTPVFPHFNPADDPYGYALPISLPALTITPQMIYDSYDPLRDTAALLADPSAFERLRDTYPLRPETAYSPA